MEKVRSNFTLDSSEKAPPSALCVVWIPRPRPPKVPSPEYPRGTVRTAVTTTTHPPLYYYYDYYYYYYYYTTTLLHYYHYYYYTTPTPTTTGRTLWSLGG